MIGQAEGSFCYRFIEECLGWVRFPAGLADPRCVASTDRDTYRVTQIMSM
jgi:hypothetical protein